ncbi:hypothetical protein ACSL103130_03355 [Actinomyces slackii]|uniref:BD-FAE-like domain-containing protein n=1 Tax=Actinomyces slackii TaxID=52774 RepID=A0A3S4SK82_9ACTO|nr:hypothetical protein [Actinomyces slackii]VEG74638.1 Uncharacterised protein [Actinomyces slackii]
MHITRRSALSAASALAAGAGLGACSWRGPLGASSGSSAAQAAPTTAPELAVNQAAWSYDSATNVYYQLGLRYAATPQAPELQTLAIFVPGAYMSATDNGDGTYTASVNSPGALGGFTAENAPTILPIDTPDHASQAPMTEFSYDAVRAYVEAGLIYVHVGTRGIDTHAEAYTGNAPWAAADLKAAVRYLRYNAALLPGDAQKIFVFGQGAGGGLGAVLGASGDCRLYAPYLAALGAATTDTTGHALSDAVAGVMCWCPIVSLDSANGAYEWNMGQFTAEGSRAEGTWTRRYSQDLARAYAAHLNSLRLVDSTGLPLTLEPSQEGIDLAGSYYDYLVRLIESCLNDFLQATAFPYTSSPGTPEEITYPTIEDYIASLNAQGQWVTYDAAAGTASVNGLAGFIASQKPALKDVGAFDGTDRGQPENLLMGSGDTPRHFSAMSRRIMALGQADYRSLEGWSAEAGASGYEKDIVTTDAQGTSMTERVAMYDPLHFLLTSSPGRGTSTIAPAWRIRSGIMQREAPLTMEANLALALAQAGVSSLDFAPVWGQGHAMAELGGNPAESLIAWVRKVAA